MIIVNDKLQHHEIPERFWLHHLIGEQTKGPWFLCEQRSSHPSSPIGNIYVYRLSHAGPTWPLVGYAGSHIYPCDDNGYIEDAEDVPPVDLAVIRVHKDHYHEGPPMDPYFVVGEFGDKIFGQAKFTEVMSTHWKPVV